MNHLDRDIAPLTAEAWQEIDNEASQTLRALLAARKLVDVTGPHGWGRSAIDLGRIETIKSKGKGDLRVGLRKVQPLVEIRVPFTLPRTELAAIARGAKDADLSCVSAAAKTIAAREDEAVFGGMPAANIEGIVSASPYAALTIDKSYGNFPEQVAEAISTLTERGIDGPFSVAVDLQTYVGLTRATHAGAYPLLKEVRNGIDGALVKTPLVSGCVVVSQRGGDFELSIGQDFSIGYLEHNATDVSLYIEESFTFLNLAPEAAIALQLSAK